MIFTARLLSAAEAIMAFEIAGWQSSPALGCSGGLPFSNLPENSTRNTITTAPAAELAVQLYRTTHQGAYLQFALMAYEWVRSCLLEPGGLYGDHVDRRGILEPHLWSYTQGVMIGAGTLLYQATGDGVYLYQARQTAAAALASAPSPTIHPGRRSPRPTSTTPGSTTACPTTSSSPGRRRRGSCWSRPPSPRSMRCSPRRRGPISDPRRSAPGGPPGRSQ